jgi:hypothetical protein
MKNFFASFFSSFLFLLGVSIFYPYQVSAQTCAVTPTSTDSVTITFSVPETNTYTIWTRLFVADTTNNSVYLQIDNGCAVNVGDSSSIPANTFTWVNYKDGNTASPITTNLAAGNHTLKITARESNVGVDSLNITTSGAVPTSPYVTPQFYSIAPCPTCAEPPLTSVIISPVVPTSYAGIPTSGIDNPVPSSNPCETTGSSLSSDHGRRGHHHHRKHRGGVSGSMDGFLNFLLQLLNMLLKLLGGGEVTLPSPTPDPCASPTSSVMPTPSVTP